MPTWLTSHSRSATTLRGSGWPERSGRGPFRRFKDELYEKFPDLVSVWQAFRDARAQRRAVGWLLDQGLISQAAAQNFNAGHPDPDLP